MAQVPGASQIEMDELMNEIAFQKVLLDSIDDSVENRHEAEEEIREEIKSLEKQLRALRRGQDPPSPIASTPHSKRPSDILSPSQMSLPTRKRSHSTQHGGLVPFEQNKSRRSSPSPYMAGPSTPAASSGDSDLEAFDSAFFEEAINHQKVQEQRIKQEKADAEFALSLSQNGGFNPPVGRPPASPQSAFDRMTGTRRPPASTVKPEPNVKREQSSASYSMGSSSDDVNGVKSELSSSRMPGAFGDDGESDFEIIPAQLFRPNERFGSSVASGSRNFTGGVYGTQQTSMRRPSFSPEAQTAGEAALRRVQQTATNNALPMSYGSMPGSFPRPGIGMPNNSGYGSPQPWVGVGGNFVYPNGAGISQINAGMYAGYTGGNVQNADPLRQGNVLNDAAGSLFGGGSMGNAIDIDGPGPFLGFGGCSDPMSAIFSRPLDATMGDQYDYIMNDPRKTNEEIQALLENIHHDEELPLENREGTPEGLTYPLYEHQKIALTWMKSMEEGTNKGGILADDMGLGKTISTIALILSRPSSDRTCKTTLIVGPVALVKQWDREFRTKIKASHRLSVHMIHGAGRRLSWDELRSYDIVLTTYGTVGAEFKRLEKWLHEQKTAGPDYDRAPMKKLFPLLGENSKFFRVVLDEAQMIKNKSTFASRAAKHLRALTRFCLTGTPMMNNVGELYSLIHFLRIKPYNEWARFQEAFGKLTRGDASRREAQDSMRKLQAVLKAILLRRTKTSLIDGKPILNLPPKTEEVQHVVFNEDEQAYYNALESRTQIQFNKYLRANTVGKNYSNVLVLLLRLRQACCHPHLIQDLEEIPPAGVNLDAEKMIELAKGLAPDVVGRLLAAEGFECPVCYDGVANPTIVIPCGHDTCSECLSKISDQAVLQNRDEGNEAGAVAKCPTCRGKIDLNQIIDYTTFKKVHHPDENAEEKVVAVADDSETQSEDDRETDTDSESESADDADQGGNLKGFIVPDDIEESEDEEEGEDGDDEAERAPKRNSKSKKAKKDKRRKSKGKKKEVKEHLSLAMLKKEASKTAAGRRKYMKYLRKNWQPSAKVDKCVELLDGFHTEGHKCIVFSQFVSLLDLLQVPIDEKGWKCERYDGGMNATARNDAILRFTEKRDVKIMLISLKAGNAGLNLVAASRVIILDPFWNPYIEMQAVDRAYRIGQQFPVEVHRILVEKTVEDRIIELQEQKRKLVDSALDEGASKSLGRLSVGQLAYLFGVGGAGAGAAN